MADKERTYNIPLRKEFRKVPIYARTPKAVRALKQFMQKHMKTEDIKLGKYLNKELWKNGNRNPPYKVSVTAKWIEEKDKKYVKVELVGAPEEKPKEEKKKGLLGKIKGKGKEKEEKPEEKKEEKKEEKPEEKKEEKKEEKSENKKESKRGGKKEEVTNKKD
ncbi:MAG: 60S ribosomal protein L31 [Nanoarchaeota archaeon]|nr:60S ribosomal protein L31 [Nanoarchaeota archaeon]